MQIINKSSYEMLYMWTEYGNVFERRVHQTKAR